VQHQNSPPIPCFFFVCSHGVPSARSTHTHTHTHTQTDTLPSHSPLLDTVLRERIGLALLDQTHFWLGLCATLEKNKTRNRAAKKKVQAKTRIFFVKGQTKINRKFICVLIDFPSMAMHRAALCHCCSRRTGRCCCCTTGRSADRHLLRPTGPDCSSSSSRS
jgi:hypothetical protein